jgi:hypothetical protein
MGAGLLAVAEVTTATGTAAGLCQEPTSVPPGAYAAELAFHDRQGFTTDRGERGWMDATASEALHVVIGADGSVTGTLDGRSSHRWQINPAYPPEGWDTRSEATITGRVPQASVTSTSRITGGVAVGNLPDTPPRTTRWELAITGEPCTGVVHMDLGGSPLGTMVLDWHGRYGVPPDAWAVDLAAEGWEPTTAQQTLANVDRALAARPAWLLEHAQHGQLEAWYGALLTTAADSPCAQARVYKALVADLTDALVVDLDEADRLSRDGSLAGLSQAMITLLNDHVIAHTRAVGLTGCTEPPAWDPFAPPVQRAGDRYVRAHIFHGALTLSGAYNRMFGGCGLTSKDVLAAAEDTYAALVAGFASASALDQERLVATALAAETTAALCGHSTGDRVFEWLMTQYEPRVGAP